MIIRFTGEVNVILPKGWCSVLLASLERDVSTNHMKLVNNDQIWLQVHINQVEIWNCRGSWFIGNMPKNVLYFDETLSPHFELTTKRKKKMQNNSSSRPPHTLMIKVRINEKYAKHLQNRHHYCTEILKQRNISLECFRKEISLPPPWHVMSTWCWLHSGIS